MWREREKERESAEASAGQRTKDGGDVQDPDLIHGQQQQMDSAEHTGHHPKEVPELHTSLLSKMSLSDE